MVLPPRPSPLDRLWVRMAELEAGNSLTIFTVKEPDAGAPPQAQADLVRAVADRSAAAVIVVPGDPESLASALSDVRDRGVTPILLGTSVPVPGKPITVVRMKPIDELATELVSAVLEDAARADLATSGPALILATDSVAKEVTRPRAEALRIALESKGVTVKPILFLGINTPAEEQLDAALAAEDPPILLFGTDDMATTTAVEHRADMATVAQPGLLIAGFADQPDTLTGIDYGMLNAAVEANLPAPAREAVRAAQKAIRGEALPEQIVTPSPIQRATGPPRGESFPKLRLRPPDVMSPGEAPPEGG